MGFFLVPTSVFISYSHDSSDHKDFVRSISDRLRSEGLNCQVDQYINGFPPEGWQRWMETQIEQADFVLLICTKAYLQRYQGPDSDGGHGVNFEGVVISQTLYGHYYRNTKFIPVIPEGGSFDNVPLPLRVYGTFTLFQDYTELYRFLTNQPSTPAPEIGDKIDLGTSKGNQFLSNVSQSENMTHWYYHSNNAPFNLRIVVYLVALMVAIGTDAQQTAILWGAENLRKAGQIYFEERNFEKAIIKIEESNKILENPTHNFGSNDIKRQLGRNTGLNLIGDILLEKSRLEKNQEELYLARQAYTASYKNTEELTKKYPNNTKLKYEFSIISGKQGELNRREGDPEKGIDYVYQQLEILRSLLDSEPIDIEWERAIIHPLQYLFFLEAERKGSEAKNLGGELKGILESLLKRNLLQENEQTLLDRVKIKHSRL